MDNCLGKLLRFFSDITKSSEKIPLVESDKIFTKDAKNGENLNTFCLNTVKNLKIPDCEEVIPFAEKLSHPILKAIFNYNKHSNNDASIGEHFNFHVLVLMCVGNKKTQ